MTSSNSLGRSTRGVTATAAEVNAIAGGGLSSTELGILDGALCTTAELNRATDVSTRLVAAGSTLAVTEALHDGKIIALDTAAGCTVTLPASSGSGAVYRFLVTVTPTSNQHTIQVANATDVLSGSVNLLDNDAAAQTAYAATGADDTWIGNGTTKGGIIGDTITVVDMLAGFFHISGQTVCPAGSNPVDCFSAAVS